MTRPPGSSILLLDPASQQVARLYDAELRRAGLDWVRYTLLSTLSLGHKARIVGLARALGLPLHAVSIGLRRLRAKGLARQVRGTDRRKRYWVVTPKGHASRQRANPHWHEAQRKLRKIIGVESFDGLQSALNDLDWKTKASR